MRFKYISAKTFQGNANIVFKKNPENKLAIQTTLNQVTTYKNDLYLDITNVDPPYHKAILYNLAKRVYRFDRYKGHQHEKENVIIYIISKLAPTFYTRIINRIKAVNMARALASEPSNIINPGTFCDYATSLFASSVARVKINNEQDLKNMGMGLVTGVGGGSRRGPRLLVIEIDGESASKVCFVGKGVTFDSGGYNIKPG